MHRPLRHAAMLAALAALAPAVRAQDPGRGNLGVNGREPRLEVFSAAPGNRMRFRVTDLAPPAASGAQLLLLVAGRPAEIPLDGLGVTAAVLGVDPGTLFTVGPIPVSAAGRADLAVPVVAAWTGVSLFVQAVYVDPRLRPPLVFSDSRSLTIGSPAPELVLAADATLPGALALVRRFPDGAPGTPLPALAGVVLVDLDLVSLDEDRRFRPDLARPVVLGGKRAVRLADGSVLVLYADLRVRRSGLLRVHPTGRVERIAAGPLGNLVPRIAASARLVAFVTLVPPRLMLYRSDGSNWPASAEPARDVTPAPGLVVEPAALVFGSRVLAYIDKRRGPFLIPLAGGSVIVPKLPPSGGRQPAVFDEELGVSGDGRSFAFGAGPGKKVKDVYVVRDDGTAFNVTKRVTDYAEVGYRNPGRRIDLALNQDGSLVSYVDEGGKEPEGFVSKVVPPRPIHITTSKAFSDSIDIGSTSRFPAKGGGLIVAGFDVQSLDLFFTPSISSTDVVPLTRTAPINKPPFGKGAKLTLLDLGSVRGGHQYLAWVKHQLEPSPSLLVIDTVTRSARKAAAAFRGHGVALRGSPRVVVEDGGAVVLVDPTDRAAGFAKKIPLGAGSVRGMSADPATGRVAVVAGTAGRLDLWVVETRAQGKATKVTAAASALGDVRAGHLPGEVHLLSAPAAGRGRQLLRYRAGRGLAAVGGSGLRFFVQR